MTEEINSKLNDLIDSIDNNLKTVKMKELKERIYNDKILEKKLKEFRELDNKYSKEYVELKRDILDNPIVREYQQLENELYFTVLEINKRLNSLIDRKKCLF